MRESDALENNPHVSHMALEALHPQLYGWALSRCDFDHATAEDLMQQTYVELLSGKARFDNQSTLKTFVFSVIQNLASDGQSWVNNGIVRERVLAMNSEIEAASPELWAVLKARIDAFPFPDYA